MLLEEAMTWGMLPRRWVSYTVMSVTLCRVLSLAGLVRPALVRPVLPSLTTEPLDPLLLGIPLKRIVPRQIRSLFAVSYLKSRCPIERRPLYGLRWPYSCAAVSTSDDLLGCVFVQLLPSGILFRCPVSRWPFSFNCCYSPEHTVRVSLYDD